MIIVSDAERTTAATVNPWIDRKPNCRTMTGGDWYMTLLTASLGGKSVHGANTAPTPEVIGKHSSLTDQFGNYGVIKMNTELKDIDKIGTDIADLPYTGHRYRGTTTTSGALLAFQEGVWEPSNRTRAKSTSLLAAGIHAHGLPIKDAIRTVSIIASDTIDEEAVISTVLPASHLKREMTCVSKANHRLFSKGTLQSAITWDDSRINLTGDMTNMAFDWGRVTTLARYIAEANIQVCEAFRLIAENIGIGYFIIRNSWAYVSDADYYLRPEIFANVKSIDIAKYGIPTLKGSFVNHEEDVLIALTRTLGEKGSLRTEDSLHAYYKLQEGHKKSHSKRFSRKNKRTMARLCDIRSIPITEHRIGPLDAVEMLEHPLGVWQDLVRAVADRLKYDQALKADVALFEAQIDGSSKYYELLDRLSSRLYAKPTWIQARAHTFSRIHAKFPTVDDEAATALAALSDLKCRLLGVSFHIETDVRIPASRLAELRGRTLRLIDDGKAHDDLVRFTQSDMQDFSKRLGDSAFDKIGATASDILPMIREDICPILEEWVERVQLTGKSDAALRAHELSCLGYAIRKLTLTDCLSKSSGYVDGAAPEKSFIYLYTKKCLKNQGLKIIRLPRLVYAHVRDIAHELAKEYGEYLDFTGLVAFVIKGLDVVMTAMIKGEVCFPALLFNIDEYEIPDRPRSPPYAGGVMDNASKYSWLQVMMNRQEAERAAIRNRADTYESIINTYDSVAIAERYANLMGYSSFREAFDKLGTDAANYPGNEFLIAAQVKASEATRADKGKEEEVQVKKKTKYDSLI